jgi:hypothetical protein
MRSEEYVNCPAELTTCLEMPAAVATVWNHNKTPMGELNQYAEQRSVLLPSFAGFKL